MGSTLAFLRAGPFHMIQKPHPERKGFSRHGLLCRSPPALTFIQCLFYVLSWELDLLGVALRPQPWMDLGAVIGYTKAAALRFWRDEVQLPAPFFQRGILTARLPLWLQSRQEGSPACLESSEGSGVRAIRVGDSQKNPTWFSPCACKEILAWPQCPITNLLLTSSPPPPALLFLSFPRVPFFNDQCDLHRNSI